MIVIVVMEERENNKTCLYLHTKSESKEVFYVGIGNARRPYAKGKRRSKLWRRVVNKYGYEVIILADNLTREQACDMEKYLIKYYGRRDLGTGTLVNMTEGGEGSKGYITSEETKAKQSAANKGKIRSAETKANISKARTGTKASEETKAKMSKARRGKGNSMYGKKQGVDTKYKISLKNRGESSAKSKLTEDQVIDILIELRDNPYLGQNRDLATKYGVKKNAISDIKTNKTWTYICRDTLNILN